MNSLNKYNIGVLGLGQMGGSIAGALLVNGAARSVYGYDINEMLLSKALNKNIISRAATSVDNLIENSEIVVLALPIDSIIDILNQYSEPLEKKELIIDLGSIRTPVQKTAMKFKITNHVGIHPICGSALRGEESWNSKLFEGTSCFVFPREPAKPNALSLADKVVNAIGGKRIDIDCRKHDELFAITSGLPHILALSLTGIWNEIGSAYPMLAGPSFKSATRVSSSEPEMLSQILYHNRRHLKNAISNLETKLNEFKSALSKRDSGKLKRMLENYANDS